MRSFAALVALSTTAGCVTGEAPDEASSLAGLPWCASPLFTAIYRDTVSHLDHGTIGAAHFATEHNAADATALIEGPKIFPAMHQLIAAAEREVDFQTYVWEPGSDPVNDILAGLTDLAHRRAAQAPGSPPVIVRFLFDASTLGYGSQIVEMPQAWAEVEALKLDPRYVQFELAGYYRSALGALHVKTVVVDGHEAIITGANPQAHHDYAMPWHDAGFHFSGDVARGMQDDFDDAWSRSKAWTCGGNTDGTPSQCATANAPIVRPADPTARYADACQPILVTTKLANTSPTNNKIDNPVDEAYLAAFANAEHVIRIQTPNLNDDAARRAIVDAVLRGVRVDVILSKGFNDGSEAYPGQGGTNEDNVAMLYDQLAQARVVSPCDLLRFRWHAHAGAVVVGNGVYASHAKYASVDDAVAIVGTANQDTQSWNNSREVNIVVDDAAVTQAWDAQLFTPDFDAGLQVDQCR